MTRTLVGTSFVTVLLAACSDGTMPAGPSAQPVSNGSVSTTGGTTTGTPTPTGCVLPAQPSRLRVTSTAGTVVELAWDGVPGATGYILTVGSVPTGSDVLNANTSQNTFRFTARDGLQWARVHAQNDCGTGPPSAYLELNIRR